MKEGMNRKWKVILYILYIDMILLIIRSCYRVAEYGNLEYHNPISTNEKYFYTLDIMEMLLLNVLWVPFHPGFWDMSDDSSVEVSETSSKNAVECTDV